MWYAGIDVGKKGGVVVIDEFSTIQRKHAFKDYKAFLKFVQDLYFKRVLEWGFEVVFVIEDVHSLFGMSAKSNFSFGHIKGFKEGALMALDFEYHLVQPKVWQKGVWLPEDVVINDKQKKDTKATSLNAAKRLWKDEDFLATERSRVPHDGLVDAALMAEYCRIINKK